MDSSPGSVRSSVPVTQVVKAVYSFQGENNDELCIAKGDLITLTQTPEGGWYEGTLNEVTGWFPSNYVEAVDGQLVISQQNVSQETLVQLPDKSDSQQYRKLVMICVIVLSALDHLHLVDITFMHALEWCI